MGRNLEVLIWQSIRDIGEEMIGMKKKKQNKTKSWVGKGVPLRYCQIENPIFRIKKYLVDLERKIFKITSSRSNKLWRGALTFPWMNINAGNRGSRPLMNKIPQTDWQWTKKSWKLSRMDLQNLNQRFLQISGLTLWNLRKVRPHLGSTYPMFMIIFIIFSEHYCYLHLFFNLYPDLFKNNFWSRWT